jgi:hypothetical protein
LLQSFLNGPYRSNGLRVGITHSGNAAVRLNCRAAGDKDLIANFHST